MDAKNTIKTISYITLFVMVVYLVLSILDVDQALTSLMCLIGYIVIDCFIIAYNAAEKKKNKTEEQ
jgi:L-asparagine transporter-like permease